MKRLRLKPAFNPIYQVHFFLQDASVFFLNEYPLPSLFIADARLFDLLSLIDGTKRVQDIAQALAHLFSASQVQDLLARLPVLRWSFVC